MIAREQDLGIHREILFRLDRDLREKLTSWELSAGDLRAAATLTANYESSYAQMISNIMNNPEIPATERQRYINHANSIRDSNMNLLEQLFSVDLEWTTPEGGSTTPTTNPDGNTTPNGAEDYDYVP